MEGRGLAREEKSYWKNSFLIASAWLVQGKVTTLTTPSNCHEYFDFSFEPGITMAEAASEGLACPRCDKGALVCIWAASSSLRGDDVTANDDWVCCCCHVKLSSIEHFSDQIKVFVTVTCYSTLCIDSLV